MGNPVTTGSQWWRNPVVAAVAAAAAVSAALLSKRLRRVTLPTRFVRILTLDTLNPPVFSGLQNNVEELRLAQVDPVTKVAHDIAVLADNRTPDSALIGFDRTVPSPSRTRALVYSLIEVSDGFDYRFEIYGLFPGKLLCWFNDESIKTLPFGRASFASPKFDALLATLKAQGLPADALAALDYRLVAGDPPQGPAMLDWLSETTIRLSWSLPIRQSDEPEDSQPFANELFDLRFDVGGTTATFAGFSPPA